MEMKFVLLSLIALALFAVSNASESTAASAETEPFSANENQSPASAASETRPSVAAFTSHFVSRLFDFNVNLYAPFLDDLLTAHPGLNDADTPVEDILMLIHLKSLTVNNQPIYESSRVLLNMSGIPTVNTSKDFADAARTLLKRGLSIFHSLIYALKRKIVSEEEFFELAVQTPQVVIRNKLLNVALTFENQLRLLEYHFDPDYALIVFDRCEEGLRAPIIELAMKKMTDIGKFKHSFASKLDMVLDRCEERLRERIIRLGLRNICCDEEQLLRLFASKLELISPNDRVDILDYALAYPEFLRVLILTPRPEVIAAVGEPWREIRELYLLEQFNADDFKSRFTPSTRLASWFPKLNLKGPQYFEAFVYLVSQCGLDYSRPPNKQSNMLRICHDEEYFQLFVNNVPALPLFHWDYTGWLPSRLLVLIPRLRPVDHVHFAATGYWPDLLKDPFRKLDISSPIRARVRDIIPKLWATWRLESLIEAEQDWHILHLAVLSRDHLFFSCVLNHDQVRTNTFEILSRSFDGIPFLDIVRCVLPKESEIRVTVEKVLAGQI